MLDAYIIEAIKTRKVVAREEERPRLWREAYEPAVPESILPTPERGAIIIPLDRSIEQDNGEEDAA